MTCTVTGAEIIGSVLNVKESVSSVFQKSSMKASPAFEVIIRKPASPVAKKGLHLHVNLLKFESKGQMTSKQVVICSLFKEATSRICHKERAAAALLLSLL